MYCRLAAKHVDEGGAAVPPSASGSTPAGHDDGLGPILPDLGSLLHADKPNARRSVVSDLAPRAGCTILTHAHTQFSLQDSL